jgi:3-dehydroquinate dehydratase
VPTLLCVPITVSEPAAALRDARQAKDLGADLVEFRLDDVFLPW